MEPIVLTFLGETLIPQYSVPVKIEETSFLRAHSTIGLHKLCGGWVYVHEISETHSAIVCQSCCLRVAIPNNVRTFKDLREYLWESWGRKASDYEPEKGSPPISNLRDPAS